MFNILLIILELSCIHLPLILGSYISMSLLKVPDLSIEAAYVFGALIGAKIAIYCTSLPTALSFIIVTLASIFAGTFVGLISSLLTQKAKIPHLLSAILTIGIFYGINQLITGSSTYISLTNNSVLNIAPLISQHPELIMIIMIALCCITLCYFLLKTQLGYCFGIYGNNQRFFAFHNISTAYIFITGILISNALAGFAGFLTAQSNNFADVMMGFGKPLLCITVLVLGKALMGTRQKITVLVPIIGTFTYFSVQQLLLRVGLNLKYFSAIQALLVLIILVVAYRKRSQQTIDHLGI